MVFDAFNLSSSNIYIWRRRRIRLERCYAAFIRGKIEFPIGVDKNNRPYQIYDPKEGRNSVSRWELVREYRLKRSPENTGETENGLWRTKVRFFPETGRTHQLRVHSAHSMGLSTPIIGDRLYGYQNPGERLCLHASKIRFVHPITGKTMEFTSSEPFWYLRHRASFWQPLQPWFVKETAFFFAKAQNLRIRLVPNSWDSYAGFFWHRALGAKACHPDRAVGEWRDLVLAFGKARQTLLFAK